ncbi:RNA-BINDING PROTEIN 19-RELATED [Salix purpurea]|uniref:RNA-BINDING PROTEIN 19-RELATED n=1 Tax=Salix purpurea TaxID=77065 RepID=A0A9Q0QET2_SALPP|nr:RNA-BINDING PROTEIN 19-RELATED [Salix purpurea]
MVRVGNLLLLGSGRSMKLRKLSDTSINLTLILVELFVRLLVKLGIPDIPRPWSRYSKKIEEKLSEDENNVAGVKSLDVKGAKDEKKNKYNEKGNEIDDPRLQEFLQVMQPRAKSKLWENDSIVVHTADLNGEVGKKASQGKKEGKEKSVPVEVEIDKGNSDTDEESNDLARDEAVSDMDYFRSRVKKELSDSESESGGSDDENENSDDESENNDESLQRGNVAQAEVAEDTHAEDLENPSSTFKDEKEEILETGRLFVRNLPYTAIEDELEEHFSKFGNISQVHLVVDKDTKRSKGLAYIHYTVPESAARALEELDNSIFQGRLLHVMPAKQKILSNKQETSDLLSQGSKTLKQRRQEEKKAAEASGDTRAWNSLFFHHDTVIENIARRHGVSKSDLLDREADDLAVRVALGETQVIAETKKALTNAGVNITALEEIAAGKKDGMKRSNHVLLVKNLSYGSSEVELAEKFGKFGSLDKNYSPSNKNIGSGCVPRTI